METFNQLIQSDKPVLVDFYADWCGPCKAMDPVIKDVAGVLSGKARVVRVNIDTNQTASRNYQVTAVPTLMLFRNGKVLWRHPGLLDKMSILKVVQQHLI